MDNQASNHQIVKTDLVHLLKSAGDMLRLDILRVLKISSFGVQELAQIFSMPQPGMSHHLKVLSKTGLVVARREGNSLFYRRQTVYADSPIQSLLHSLFETIDQTKLSADIVDQIEKVNLQRGAVSKEFFTKYASVFEQEQGRIANYGQYSNTLEDLISHLEMSRRDLAIEIGPGEGELLNFLSQAFATVVGLDNSAEMLNRCRELLGKNEVKNASLIQGEMDSLRQKYQGKINLLAMNMVLHHFPDPSEKIQLCSHLLADDGLLMVADLCDHHQDWVKDSCGDVWLGFPPQDLDEWAQAANLSMEHNIFLGLKNGFQIQIKIYRKK